MVLEKIYVVRHGYRISWIVDPQTGEYQTSYPLPTGIPSDVPLASYGVIQAEQLATHLAALDPPVDCIYSSPFYRCLQTLDPFVTRVAQQACDTGMDGICVNVERGLGEFYGRANFDHPSPAKTEVLRSHFAHIGPYRGSFIVPSVKGETVPQLHDRMAYCLHRIIERIDSDPAGPKALLICSHAAAIIAIGRVLTGRMPEDEGEEDFRCFTCGFSKFVRRPQDKETPRSVSQWLDTSPDHIPDVGWRGGRGVAGGWLCEINSDCSFLEGGEERGWKFTGDESFIDIAETKSHPTFHKHPTKGNRKGHSESGSRL